MDESPIWTLKEANAALPGLEVLTEFAVEELENSARCWRGLPFRAWDSLRGIAIEDGVRADWARAVTLMGMQPKGYFVVDFQSPDPDVLWCWSYGEETITHQHQTWETFGERRLIPRNDDNNDNNAADEAPESDAFEAD